MTTEIEARLRRHYTERTRHLSARGPGLDTPARRDVRLAAPMPSDRGRRRGVLVGATAAAVVVAGLAVLGPVGRDAIDRAPGGPDEHPGDERPPHELPASPTDPGDVLAPAVTLPDTADLDTTPVTVLGAAPSSWFRVAPDLDLAWHVAGDAADSTICWRTPVATECQPYDAFPVVVATAGDQTLVLVQARWGDVHVQLDDGTGLRAPIVASLAEHWMGVARFELPAGAEVVSSQVVTAATPLTGEPESVDVTGDTLPPSGDLSAEVPPTVPEGTALSYWRLLPDLDIAERAPPGRSELCWRTPAGEGCIDNTFHSPQVAVIPTDGAAILLTRPAPASAEPAGQQPDTMPTAVTVVLSDGTTHELDVQTGRRAGLGFARVDLAGGVTVVSASSS